MKEMLLKMSRSRVNVTCFIPPPSSLIPAVMVVIYNFADVCKGDFDYFAVGAFHFDGWRGQGLRGFHAADDAAHTFAVDSNDLYVVLGVERLQG
jgi:hypothetical protein